jgi:hypothetical protein
MSLNLNNMIEEVMDPTCDLDNTLKETEVPKRKGKEKIPASVKNTLWSLHFQCNLNGICQCCKTENIS